MDENSQNGPPKFPKIRSKIQTLGSNRGFLKRSRARSRSNSEAGGGDAEVDVEHVASEDDARGADPLGSRGNQHTGREETERSIHPWR